MIHMTSSRPARRRQLGVTLIELMVTMAIIGILAAVAYPSYVKHVLKSNRSNAQAILMENAQFMERFFTANNTYVGATGVTAVVPKGAIGTKIRYNITYSVDPSPTGYTFQAVPVGTQANDACGTLTLAHTGQQTPATGGCW